MSDSLKPKKAKATFFRTRGLNRRSSFRKHLESMVIYTPTRTWRGKPTYRETQNDPLHNWIPFRSTYVSILLELEAPLETMTRCMDCLRPHGPIHCLSCLGDQAWCRPCAVKELGFTLNLGHDRNVCPLNSDGSRDQFTVVDLAGIFVHTPQTVFTFNILDKFLIDELECKTSASSFYSKLRRLTNNAFPDFLPDHYQELMRVSRMAELSHYTERNPGNGDLAIFCPACPQPGLNLPDEWAQEYDRLPEDDITLSDGLAYMVANRPYQEHVSKATDNEERSSCQNHRAVNNANTSKTHLRAIGVSATACACHGCFVAHSVVDFYKGEQHKNVDYSICQAVSYKSQGIQKAVIIYNVACHWHMIFSTRINDYPALSWPMKIEITLTIGKFHLSAHKPYWAGHLDREILETIWTPFNKISPSARSMTLAHRQELYDDHMRDSNWKKLVISKLALNVVKSLLRKHKVAFEWVQTIKGPYEEFTPSLTEMRLDLLEAGRSPSGNEGSVTWLVDGISIEDAHIQTAVQKANVAQKRNRLQGRIIKFNESASLFATDIQLGSSSAFTTDDPGFCNEEQGDPIDDVARERVFWGVEAENGEDEEDAQVESSSAEDLKLAMPSAWGTTALLKDAGLEHLIKEELRTHLGHKSVLFWMSFQSSSSIRTDFRSKQDIRKHVQSYHWAQEALIQLQASQDILQRYQLINCEELRVAKDITEENCFGQSSDISAPWNAEFDRISWLKARARYERWREELGMQWERRRKEAKNSEHMAYAAKQKAVWEKFREKAEESFGASMIVRGN
ncbi:hypothetical protein L210DRAFT_961004 [Boletus edulis BED1]|uniref:CxC2-like cysteine cluster KDZ transposase-associated domain-containing protein n=1 Tax=Boletus edulis BED1 TaxID=1328754 RepID=A0AAD4BI29_BOLED|nr:hypothetical protein L210DRAFT_961004 [Boletus edulis BED1]